MNERIQELHQRAKDFINEVSDADGVYQGKEYMQAVREKFAELIVRECIKQAHSVGNLRGANDDMIYGADTAAVQISKHFGVN